MPAKFAGSSTEGVADHGRRESRRIFSDFIYISPVVSATTSNKNFQKIRYRAPYSHFFRKMGVADHARRESRRIFSDFICTTSGLSYHLEQKFSKNTLPCSVQPISDGQTDRRTVGRTHEHSEIINIDRYNRVE